MNQAQRIAAKVGGNFRCFGGGDVRTASNPISHALKDAPLQFAGGVDVEEVVAFILKESTARPRAKGLLAYIEARQKQLHALAKDQVRKGRPQRRAAVLRGHHGQANELDVLAKILRQNRLAEATEQAITQAEAIEKRVGKRKSCRSCT